METRFQILINIKVPAAMMEIGRFCIGNEQTTAENLFNSLAGKKDTSEEGVIRLDLIQVEEGVSLILGNLYCRLHALQHNCGVITKEIFKQQALEGGSLTAASR